jgi:hypothetical protein
VPHMRIITPADRTDAVRGLLVAEPGATHVTVLPGVAVQPAGDVVEADITREAVDGVPAAPCGLGIDRAGGGRPEGRYVQAIQSAAQPAINLVGVVVAAATVALRSRRIRSRGRRSCGGGRRLSTG